MDTKALQLASRFSYAPNSLGYCGRDTATQKFVHCITQERCTGVDEELTKFIALHPYLKMIGKITNKPIFSYDVIESYWLGNSLLQQARDEYYSLLLEAFIEQGVPDWLVDELKTRSPKVFIPNHLFQVLHVGVGRASGVVPFNLQSINNCMIRWGKVEALSAHDCTAKLNSLKKDDDSYSIKFKQVTLPYDSNMTGKITIGDTIAVHWNKVIKILDQREEKNLSFWTEKVCTGLYR